MDTNILKKAGLNESQAKAYKALVVYGALSPADLAIKIDESRTNTYAIIDKLVKYGVITKKSEVKYGAKYIANHPSSLESLAEARRKVAMRNEQAVEQSLSELVHFFYEHDEQPGIMTYFGKEGIKKVYESILSEGQDLTYLRSPHDSGYMTSAYYKDYRQRRAGKDIVAHPISPDLPRSRHNPATNEKYNIANRAWLHPKDYTANVEWNVYGDRVSIITFGEEAISVTIQSEAIADSVNQIFDIMRMGAKESYAEWEKERPKDYYTPVSD